MNLNTLMQSLARLGVWDIVLPFMLIFTIVYATLTTTLKSLFGKEGDKDNTRFAAVIAGVIALGVVIPHSIGAYPEGANVVIIINSALPQVALISVAVVGLMILLGLFGINTLEFANGGISVFLVATALGIVTYIFGSAAGWWTMSARWLGFLRDPDLQALIVSLLVFGLLVKFIVGSSSEKKTFSENLTGFTDALFGKGSSGSGSPKNEGKGNGGKG